MCIRDRVSNTTLVGSAPDNIRHYMELRGVGIINVSRLFGVGSVKNTAHINFVIQLETYDPEKVYDRIGLEEETLSLIHICDDGAEESQENENFLHLFLASV